MKIKTALNIVKWAIITVAFFMALDYSFDLLNAKSTQDNLLGLFSILGLFLILIIILIKKAQ